MVITSKIKNILKINFLKTCLVFSGLFLIYDVSENVFAVCILFACAILSYFLAFFISRKESSFRLTLGKLIVPMTFVFKLTLVFCLALLFTSYRRLRLFLIFV